MRKTILHYILIFLLVLSFSLSLADGALAQADVTTVGALELVPTYECIGVYSNFSGDGNGNNQAKLEYRIAGSPTWVLAPIPMVADRRPEVPVPDTGWDRPVEFWANPYVNQWRGNIMFLQPNTEYEVRVTYTDPEGVADNPVSGLIRTWNDNPSSAGRSYYVATTGSDSNPGTQSAPFQTLQKAADIVGPGDTVYIREGTYNTVTNVSRSGTIDNYITFQNYPGDKVNLDSGFNIQGSYVRVRGVEFRHSGNVVLITGDYVIIEDNLFTSTGDEPANLTVGSGWGPALSGRGITVQRNKGNLNMIFRYTHGNHVIRWNNMDVGSFGGGGDGIHGIPNFGIPGGPYHDSDIYHNVIYNVGDDCIEAEGGGVNVRIWGNKCHTTMGRGGIGIAIAPVIIGPMYVFRNVIYNNWGSAFKMGKLSTGDAFVYHNTVYTRYTDGDGRGAGFQDSGGEPFYNHHFRNNIVVSWYDPITYHSWGEFAPDERRDGVTDLITKMGWREYWDAGHFPWPIVDFDYDLLVQHTGESYIRWGPTEGKESYYHDIEIFSDETHQEQHGIQALPRFVDAAAADFRLQSGSPGIDAGVILPGFNDTTSPWPYVGSAPDMGAYEYGAPQVKHLPFLYSIGDKTIHEGDVLKFTISAYDLDSDRLTYSASNLPQGATFDSQTQTFSWTPAAGQAGKYPGVHFDVSDGDLTDSEDITITVTSGNRAPVLVSIGDKIVHEEALLEFTVSAYDPDGDMLTYSASNLPQGASFDPKTQTFSWTPVAGQAGVYYSVHFEVIDGELVNSEDITIMVIGALSVPIRVNSGGGMYTDSNGNIWQADQIYTDGGWGFHGENLTVDRGIGHDIDSTQDDRIYQTERYGLNGYSFDIGNGSYNIVLHFAETYSGIVEAGQRVFDVYIEEQLVIDNQDIYSEVGHSRALTKIISNVIVEDGRLNINFTPELEQPEINGIEITSADGNRPPALDPIGDKSINEGQLLQFPVYAYDPDGDQLIYSASNLPSGASFDAQTGTFSWTPSMGQAGSYAGVRFEVSDDVLSDFEEITIVVNPIPGSPWAKVSWSLWVIVACTIIIAVTATILIIRRRSGYMPGS